MLAIKKAKASANRLMGTGGQPSVAAIAQTKDRISRTVAIAIA